MVCYKLAAISLLNNNPFILHTNTFFDIKHTTFPTFFLGGVEAPLTNIGTLKFLTHPQKQFQVCLVFLHETQFYHIFKIDFCENFTSKGMPYKVDYRVET